MAAPEPPAPRTAPDGYSRLDRLAEDFAERFRRGERPSLAQYIDREPDLADQIRSLFPALVEIEQVERPGRDRTGDAAGASAGDGGGSCPSQGARIGDFEIIRVLGRGGMGIVYEADQVSLGRRVALKLLTPRLLRDARQRLRFEREARSAARLHHTNIVPVFGVGEHDGTPYYVMQYIEGHGLDRVLDELRSLDSDVAATVARDANLDVDAPPSVAVIARSLLTGRQAPPPVVDDDGSGHEPGGRGTAVTMPRAEVGASARPADHPGGERPPSSPSHGSGSTLAMGLAGDRSSRGRRRWAYWRCVAGIGAQVAQALAYAHRQGILHRDIKPSNLLLDADGTAWVADFGLAKADDRQDLTDTGDVLGTLRYMPPEAFEGRSGPCGDVYSLGLTLYELLAFGPAFEEKDRARLIKRVTTGEPERLGRRDPEIPVDLQTIVHKAIDRDPSHRYATADELATDLQRFADDEPILARRLSWGQRVGRWARRNRGVAALSAIVVLLLSLVSVVSTAAAVQLSKQRDAVLGAERVASRARARAVLDSAPDSVPILLASLKDHRRAALEMLSEVAGSAPPTGVSDLRLAVADAVLGPGDPASLCARVAATPPGEAGNLLFGLKSCRGRAAIDDLFRRYRDAGPGTGRTRLAIALLELGDPRAARDELALREDPTGRVRFIHDFAAWHGDLASSVEQLRAARDPAFRGGLTLALGAVEPGKLPPAIRSSLAGLWASLYASAADGGSHGAAGWCLRRHGLPLIELPPTRGPEGGREWFVNGRGMTMIGIEPGFFHPSDYERAGADGPAIVVTRPFFMQDTEVTWADYRRFLDSADHPPGEEVGVVDRKALDDAQAASVTGVSAVLYCNWLSRAEGRAPCYRRDPTAALGFSCDVRGAGYRLPTEAEWEHAYRDGTTTRWVVGEDPARLLDYGNLFGPDQGGSVRTALPSPRGLFDLAGNQWERCWDVYPRPSRDLLIDPGNPSPRQFSMRGGSAAAGLFYLHASFGMEARTDRPYGFRVACGPMDRGDEQDPMVAARAAVDRAGERLTGAARTSRLHDRLLTVAKPGPQTPAAAPQKAEPKFEPKEIERLLVAIDDGEGEDFWDHYSQVMSQLSRGDARSVAVARYMLGRKAGPVHEPSVAKWIDEIAGRGRPVPAARMLLEIVLARQAVRTYKRGHVVIGRVIVEGPEDPRIVKAQMQIGEEGYFADAVAISGRPVGFRLHDYEPVDVIPRGESGSVEDLGTVRLRPVTEGRKASVKGRVVLDGQPDASSARIHVRMPTGPINTPSGGYAGDRGNDPPPMVVTPGGEFAIPGLSPASHDVDVRAPGYYSTHRTIDLDPGRTTDAGEIRLELGHEATFTWVSAQQPPFAVTRPVTRTVLGEQRCEIRGPNGDRAYGLYLYPWRNRIAIQSNHGPFLMADLGPGKLEDFADVDPSKVRLSHSDHEPRSGHVYLGQWGFGGGFWVLFHLDIEKLTPERARMPVGRLPTEGRLHIGDIAPAMLDD